MGDNITRPDHYCEGRKYEPKDVIRDWGLNFNLGSAVKYISRAGRKRDKLEDLRKARQFLEFEIEAVEKEQNSKTEIEKENKTCIYVNGLLSRFTDFNSIPDEYKPRVIDKLAQEVLDSQNIPPDELREAVIGRIVERIDNDELDCFDICYNLYNAYRDIRDAMARQAMHPAAKEHKDDSGMTCKEAAKIGDAMSKGFEEGIKEAEDTKDTVSINFEFEVDPEIDTDTVNVHVHIKNKED